ncbi:MAG: hypothetical protein AMXMBFR64_57510 [Myxococcales bacterium]
MEDKPVMNDHTRDVRGAAVAARLASEVVAEFAEQIVERKHGSDALGVLLDAHHEIIVRIWKSIRNEFLRNPTRTPRSEWF